MLLIYFALLFSSSSICNGFSDEILKRLGYEDSYENILAKNNMKDLDDPTNDDNNVPWDTFYEELKKLSTEQLDKTKTNIMNNYGLNTSDVKAIDAALKESKREYEQFIHTNLKLVKEKKQFNSSVEFMIEFMDMSNYLLTQIIGFNLGKVEGRLLLPTKWYRQILRQKIMRQQVKIASNSVESKICSVLTICKERLLYSQYLVEWLRNLMNLTSVNLKTLFQVIPDLLQKYIFTIKSNIKFKKTVKFIVVSNDVVQRDTLDYLDEILTDKKNVVNLVPAALKKGATLLMSLFDEIDNNYDMNDDNEGKLEDITVDLLKWIHDGSADISQVLEAIIENMQMNLKIWPHEIQSKIDYIWTNIILL